MNRSERRKLVKELNKNPDKFIKDFSYELEKTKNDNEFSKELAYQYSVVVSAVLHDKLGFGEIRLKRVINQIYELWDSIGAGYVAIDDLATMLKEKTNVDFKR